MECQEPDREDIGTIIEHFGSNNHRKIVFGANCLILLFFCLWLGL
jgi:hypothetical protein